MLNGKETGIGPALRVLRHFTEREPFYQIKFQSGERALLVAADMPAPSVGLVRLALGGLLPWQIVWEYNPIRAGGYSDYIHKLNAMFSSTTERSNEPVEKPDFEANCSLALVPVNSIDVLSVSTTSKIGKVCAPSCTLAI